MKKLLVLVLCVACAALLFAFAYPADAIIGVWKNGSGKGHIEIYKNDGKYYGNIIWLRDGEDAEGNAKVDRKNPNPQLRKRKLIGLTMLKGFKFDGNDKWTDGKIYNPSDGKEYKAYMEMESTNKLSVRGYVGIPLLGKTDVWTRVK